MTMKTTVRLGSRLSRELKSRLRAFCTKRLGGSETPEAQRPWRELLEAVEALPAEGAAEMSGLARAYEGWWESCAETLGDGSPEYDDALIETTSVNNLLEKVVPYSVRHPEVDPTSPRREMSTGAHAILGETQNRALWYSGEAPLAAIDLAAAFGGFPYWDIAPGDADVLLGQVRASVPAYLAAVDADPLLADSPDVREALHREASAVAELLLRLARP
ncbi:MAG: hypothetical protein HY928_05780 [Elusimicrobia bacterium]|nr:hypothetical protein [Elusimicrobiota bacterium]